MKSFFINKLILRKVDLLEIFKNHIEKNYGGLFTYFNQNSFNIFCSNGEYRNILSHFKVYQEGIGMYLALKLWNYQNFERIDSTEMHKKFIQKIISLNKSIIFIGGNFDRQDLLKRSEQKGLSIEFYEDGFFEKKDIIITINKFRDLNSKFVLIGMGSPQQEILAYKLFQHFPDKVFICIGNFMNYFLGYQKRAPIIVRKLQLEWLYRLFQEPKRLFKRYVIGIPLFFYRIFFHFK